MIHTSSAQVIVGSSPTWGDISPLVYVHSFSYLNVEDQCLHECNQFCWAGQALALIGSTRAE